MRLDSRTVLSVDDWTDADVAHLLERAQHWRTGALARPRLSAAVIALIFLEASLRTRTGFSAAAQRLHCSVVEVNVARSSATSMPESWQDTLRTISGYADLVVGRLGQALDPALLRPLLRSHFLNGGDTGPRAEHPTQALIDLFAVHCLRGSVSELRIAICGDPYMRSARSLIKLLERSRPISTTLVSDPRWCRPDGTIPHFDRVVTAAADVSDVDVLYVVGMSHGSLPEVGRTRLRITQRVLAQLPESAIVLCPLPVIDEIDAEARNDPRIKMFEQSDLGLFVRMALIEEFLR